MIDIVPEDSDSESDASCNGATPKEPHGSLQAPYDNYTEWKGWGELFVFGAVDAKYFEAETRGILISKSDVLEIGFGSGRFLAWAKSKGARLSGVEIIPPLIEAARENEVTLLPADIEGVADLFSDQFDSIVAFDVFEHFDLRDIPDRLAACHKMLRPGGHLLLRFPNGQSPMGLTQQHGDPTHLVPLSLNKLRPMLLKDDWIVVRYAGQRIVGGGTIFHKAVRAFRKIIRKMVEVSYQFVYCCDHPLDAVVVLVLRKREEV